MTSALGEAGEEIVGELLDPLWQNMTYRRNDKVKGATFDELVYAGLLGAVTSGVIGAAERFKGKKGIWLRKTIRPCTVWRKDNK